MISDSYLTVAPGLFNDMSFQKDVLELVSEIPEGKVATYKKIAEALGNPKAYRAVGNALANNPKPIEIPCHRVVKSDGGIGGYAGGRERKKELLGSEGVEVKSGKVDLERYLYEGLDS